MQRESVMTIIEAKSSNHLRHLFVSLSMGVAASAMAFPAHAGFVMPRPVVNVPRPNIVVPRPLVPRPAWHPTVPAARLSNNVRNPTRPNFSAQPRSASITPPPPAAVRPNFSAQPPSASITQQPPAAIRPNFSPSPPTASNTPPPPAAIRPNFSPSPPKNTPPPPAAIRPNFSPSPPTAANAPPPPAAMRQEARLYPPPIAGQVPHPEPKPMPLGASPSGAPPTSPALMPHPAPRPVAMANTKTADQLKSETDTEAGKGKFKSVQGDETGGPAATPATPNAPQIANRNNPETTGTASSTNSAGMQKNCITPPTPTLDTGSGAPFVAGAASGVGSTNVGSTNAGCGSQGGRANVPPPFLAANPPPVSDVTRLPSHWIPSEHTLCEWELVGSNLPQCYSSTWGYLGATLLKTMEGSQPGAKTFEKTNKAMNAIFPFRGPANVNNIPPWTLQDDSTYYYNPFPLPGDASPPVTQSPLP